MKKKYILLVPVGGLANRMKATDSAIKLSQKTNSELHIIWFKDRGLNCRFDQLFEPIDLPNVKVTEATWSDYLLYDRPRQKNIFIPRLFQKATFDNCIYEKQALHLFYENFDFYDWAKNRKVYIASFVYFYSPEDENDRFSVFRPLASILQEIDTRCSLFGTNTVGVHIRRTDNALSIAQSPTRLFIERMKKEIEQNGDTTFCLASDSEEDKRSIVNRFGNRVFTSVHKADRNSLEGMQEALVELYLLSRTRHVLGSVHSSFSETAAQIGKISYELLRDVRPDK